VRLRPSPRTAKAARRSRSPRSVSSDVYPPAYEPGGGVGVPGAFTFSTRVAGVVSFGYRFDGEPDGTVDPGSDGSARITWTPTAAGVRFLTVWGIKDNGQSTDQQSYMFLVAG
jgi:hypothetical protein